mmetsp:Transcript_7145/g.17796  ORF Transcript_7145/g.17796 Transcript_7145/m.17796 type:complete len:339 (-) Transcript_7145:45-1061(-)
MAVDRGIVSFFEQATGIDVPNKIAGIEIPDPEISEIAGAATHVFEHLGDLGGDLVEKANKVREVVAMARRTAGNCWGTIDTAQDIYDSISQKIEPLGPLFKLGAGGRVDDPTEVARAMATFKEKENRETALEIIGDVLDLGKLLEKLAHVLQGVKAIFQTVMDTCGDIIEAVMDFMSDVAQEFAEALHLDSALEGLEDLFSGIAGVAERMFNIGEVLRPVVEAMKEALEETSWLGKLKEGMEAGMMMATQFGDIKGALTDFWPAWEESQKQYGETRRIGESAEHGASKAWMTFKQLLCQLCKMLNVEVPGGISALDDMARPTVAPRGGFVEEEEFVER